MTFHIRVLPVLCLLFLPWLSTWIKQMLQSKTLIKRDEDKSFDEGRRIEISRFGIGCASQVCIEGTLNTRAVRTQWLRNMKKVGGDRLEMEMDKNYSLTVWDDIELFFIRCITAADFKATESSWCKWLIYLPPQAIHAHSLHRCEVRRSQEVQK